MKRFFDMKTIRKFQNSLLFLGMMLTASCSTDVVHDEMTNAYNLIGESMDELDARVKLLEQAMGTFEGKWSLNYKEYVCEGKLSVKKDSFLYVLPEKMFVDIILDFKENQPDEPFFSSTKENWVYSETLLGDGYRLEGISEETAYMKSTFGSYYNIMPELPNAEYPPLDSPYFYVTVEGVPYRIDPNFRNGNAMYDTKLMKWTLQYSLIAITLINLETGEYQSWGFEPNVCSIKFITTRKIE